jgi:hypothetical protein
MQYLRPMKKMRGLFFGTAQKVDAKPDVFCGFCVLYPDFVDYLDGIPVFDGLYSGQRRISDHCVCIGLFYFEPVDQSVV